MTLWFRASYHHVKGLLASIGLVEKNLLLGEKKEINLLTGFGAGVGSVEKKKSQLFESAQRFGMLK